MSESATNDLSFLFPHFIELDENVGGILANLTRALRILDTAISAVEKDAPDLPQLQLLRERRQELRRLQHAVFGTSDYLQRELGSMEDDYAARTGLSNLI